MYCINTTFTLLNIPGQVINVLRGSFRMFFFVVTLTTLQLLRKGTMWYSTCNIMILEPLQRTCITQVGSMLFYDLLYA